MKDWNLKHLVSVEAKEKIIKEEKIKGVYFEYWEQFPNSAPDTHWLSYQPIIKPKLPIY